MSHISSDTAVPAWAYLDVVATDRFEAVSASQSTDLLESTVGNNEISTSSSTSPSSSSTSTSPSSTNTIGIYAIIGIAVGCTVSLGLIIGISLYIRKNGMPQLAFSRRGATPDMGTAAAGLHSIPRHRNILSGQSSLNYGQKGRPPPVTVTPYDPMNLPWSPPPTSTTPSRTMSPTSSRSLLSTHHYGSRPRHSDDGMNHRNSSSGAGTRESSENPGNRSSMLYVHSLQAIRRHVLKSLYRSMGPQMQYEGTGAPPLGTPVHAVYATARPVHVHGPGNRQIASGSSQPPFSSIPEI